MKQFLAFSPLLLLLAGSAVAGPVAVRQGQAAVPRVNPRDCRSVDGASPVWQAIGKQYSRLADAVRRKDFDALVALYSPDFQVRMPSGEVWSRDQSIAYARRGLEQAKETHQVSNTILDLRLCGNRAVATVLQQWSRSQMMNGTLRRVDTAAVQDESWTNTPAGWKRGNISNVRPGAWVVDGKRVDPGKRYDPDAPPYDPYAG